MLNIATIDPAIAGLLGVLIGTGITTLSGLVQHWLTNRTTTQQQLRDLAVKLAIEKWQYEAPKRDELKRRIASDPTSGDLSLKIDRVSLNDTVLEMVALLQAIPNKTQKPKQK